MQSYKILHISEDSLKQVKILIKTLNISPVLAQLLVNRGINSAEEAVKFLNPKLSDLHDPFVFSDMQKAVSLIRLTASKKKKILIFGDYDVDGITSLALLHDALARQGIEAEHLLPHRLKEGYGLAKNILTIAKERKIGLLITVDCGINSFSQISALRENGIEVIVTDHHEPQGKDLPQASAIINPKVQDSGYPFRELAGVGVAYKVSQALCAKSAGCDLDLAALGTVADVVPLNGENRVIVKEGLKTMSGTKRHGLKALIEESGLTGKDITCKHLGFILGPRLNASGRMDTPDHSLNLLLSCHHEEAKELAKTVNAYNRQRQKVESLIMEEAEAIVSREINFNRHKVIVISKKDWHHGVMGIVAAKLADKFCRPTILISETEGLCRGSARSIKNFHLFEALFACKDLLDNFGGHSHAAGLVLEKDNIKDFRNRINVIAGEKLLLEDLLPSVDVDMELGLNQVNFKLAEEIESLEPFGSGNPKPLFVTKNLVLRGQIRSMARETLKFWLSDGKQTACVLGFGMSRLKDALESASKIDIVYTPRKDEWAGESSLILEAKEIIAR